ncbi:MAG: SAM-dependent methyltransferase [Thermoanaerobaculia bacterium]
MSEPSERSQEIFLELYESLPRQGPGNRACAARALALCRDLPAAPVVLDLGCGVGGQTLHLAELTSGPIVAVDLHVPSMSRLRRRVADRHLSHRIVPVIGDMARPSFLPASFDLIWSEGALYNIGIENALRICRPLLRAKGHVVFTDAVWRKKDPSPAVRAAFELDYPTMGWAADIVAAIERSGFELLGHFTLPDQAWWENFYTPMQRRLEELRARYAGDEEATAVLDQLSEEPEMHRRHSDSYAYEFFVAGRE